MGEKCLKKKAGLYIWVIYGFISSSVTKRVPPRVDKMETIAIDVLRRAGVTPEMLAECAVVSTSDRIDNAVNKSVARSLSVIAGQRTNRKGDVVDVVRSFNGEKLSITDASRKASEVLGFDVRNMVAEKSKTDSRAASDYARVMTATIRNALKTEEVVTE